MNKICAFIGHRNVIFNIALLFALRRRIKEAIVRDNVDTFYLSGQGKFNKICAAAVHRLKKEYPHIRSYYISHQPPCSALQSLVEESRLYDGIIHSCPEKMPPHRAAFKRDEYMITHACLIITYINYPSGIEYKTYKYAIKKGKQVTNFGSFSQSIQ